MKRLILGLLLSCLLALPAWAAPAWVQTEEAAVGFPGTSTQNVTLGSSPGAHNVILYGVTVSPITDAISITNANGDTFTPDTDSGSDDPTWRTYWGHASNIVGGASSGALTITCLSSCSFAGFAMVADEFSGVATVSVNDGTPSTGYAINGSTSIQPGSMTTSSSGSLVWTGLWVDNSGQTITPPSGFTPESVSAGGSNFYTAFQVASPGANNPTWGNSTAASEMWAGIIGIKAAGGGGGSPVRANFFHPGPF